MRAILYMMAAGAVIFTSHAHAQDALPIESECVAEAIRVNDLDEVELLHMQAGMPFKAFSYDWVLGMDENLPKACKRIVVVLGDLASERLRADTAEAAVIAANTSHDAYVGEQEAATDSWLYRYRFGHLALTGVMMIIILLFLPREIVGYCFLGFAIGESLGASVLRIAGGIFTKIADIGAEFFEFAVDAETEIDEAEAKDDNDSVADKPDYGRV